jgi:archaellum component FlaF (FlaF/FlaG flagellin family)
MGFSTSISIVILFVGTLAIATASYTTIDRSTELLMEAKDTQQERMLDQLNTKITITGIAQQGSDLNITVKNEGSEVLNSSAINVLLDGSYVTPDSITPSGIWSPDVSINVILADVTPLSNRRIKIIVENGQSDYGTS